MNLAIHLHYSHYYFSHSITRHYNHSIISPSNHLVVSPYSNSVIDPCLTYDRKKVTKIGLPHPIEVIEFRSPHPSASPYGGDWGDLYAVGPSSCVDKQKATKVTEMGSPHLMMLPCKSNQGDQNGVTPPSCIASQKRPRWSKWGRAIQLFCLVKVTEATKGVSHYDLAIYI